jgi:ABC-type nitrate/sulfonate/bicarbonate transport system ATPase subunit
MGTSAFRVTDGARVFATPHGPTAAFRDLTLDVHEGEIHALIGPSGCGKSTLLRIIAGLDALTSGSLDVPRHANGRPQAGIVFQDAHLLPWLSVRDNVALGLRYRANRHVNPHDVDRLLDVLGIAGLANAMPHELSGGQAQRVAIARTAVTAPPLLLLDEPFAALDPLTRRGLQDWLRQVRDLLGFTVVLVTHDVDEAVHLGDRVSLMRGGDRGIVASYETATVRRGSQELDALREVLLDCYATDERYELSANIPS